MTKPRLEQTIKEYFDQYGAILVGMHQDLKSQQATVDRKLAEAEERSAASLAAFNDRADGVVTRVREDGERIAAALSSIEQKQAEHIADLSARASKALHSVADSARSFKDHLNQSRITLAAEIKNVRGQIQEAVDLHKRSVNSALDEYRTTNTIQRQWFDEHSARLGAQAADVIARLQLIDEKTAAHQLREAAFNERLRQVIIGIVVAAAIGALVMVRVWKP